MGARPVQPSMFPALRSDAATGPLIGSVIRGTNADLIAAVAPIYLDGLRVIDVTYGTGGWWRRYRPDHFDPPYIPAGGVSTSTAGDFQGRYGVNHGRSQTALDELVFAGLAECARVADRWLLAKCMDFTSGGRFRPMSYRVAACADGLGLCLWDEIVHNAGSGPGGHNIVRQIRARREHSKLFVFTHKEHQWKGS